MKKTLFIVILIGTIISCKKNTTTQNTVEGPGKVTYPATQKVDTVTNFFGTSVADPYRWLEAEAKDDSAVHNWIEAENNITFDYLSKIPYRKALQNRLTELANYPKLTAPNRAGDYYFYAKNNGLQNQYVTYYKKGIDGEEKVFYDPNTLSADGTVTLSMSGFSADRKYVAINESKAGSDWSDIYVREVASNTQLNDKISWTKFSSAAWYKNGFYYSAYDKPADNKTFTAASENQKVFYHTLGDDQAKDRLIYTDKLHPLLYFTAQTTDDEKFLFINVSEGTSGTGILWKYAADNGPFKELFKGFEWEYSVLDNDGERLLVLTNYNAPNYKVVSVDPTNPAPENWKEIIAEQKQVLGTVNLAGGKLFAFYLKDVKPVVIQYSRSGNAEKEIDLPGEGIGTIAGFDGEKNDLEVYYSFTTFLTPGDIYKYTIASGKSELYKKTDVNFNPDNFEMKQVFYPSKDGTKIPMFLVYKKGLKLDGNNPCLLYGYGGFNIAIQPSFNASRIALLEQGFVYAVANIRGGSEYGEAWHKAAMFEKKQNVFDDFIAGAEYLIKEKYTSSSKLAILGRSNGGLLVGACMTQRPDLFKVALPGVGVMDMLRYHKFTVGWGWAVEYGCADSSQTAFDYLYKYSPLHNLKSGTTYPATLVTTADHDDRVVPAHSFKFAATLQADQSGDNPCLIRIDTQAGHGSGKPLAKIIEEDADWMSFTMWNVGIKNLMPADKP